MEHHVAGSTRWVARIRVEGDALGDSEGSNHILGGCQRRWCVLGD